MNGTKKLLRMTFGTDKKVNRYNETHCYCRRNLVLLEYVLICYENVRWKPNIIDIDYVCICYENVRLVSLSRIKRTTERINYLYMNMYCKRKCPLHSFVKLPI